MSPWGTRLAIAGALALVATVVLVDRVAAFDDVDVQLAVQAKRWRHLFSCWRSVIRRAAAR